MAMTTKTTALLKITRQLPIMSRLGYSSDSGNSGAIREAGGSFSKKEAADEERYFRKLQGEQLQKLKHHLDEEITFHQQQIKQLKDSVAVHENRIAELEKKKSA